MGQENMGCEPCRNKACPNNEDISSGCIARHIHNVEQMLRCGGYTDKLTVGIKEEELSDLLVKASDLAVIIATYRKSSMLPLLDVLKKASDLADS